MGRGAVLAAGAAGLALVLAGCAAGGPSGDGELVPATTPADPSLDGVTLTPPPGGPGIADRTFVLVTFAADSASAEAALEAGEGEMWSALPSATRDAIGAAATDAGCPVVAGVAVGGRMRLEVGCAPQDAGVDGLVDAIAGAPEVADAELDAVAGI